jgi:putative hydrolase of the HAD superfamily
MIFIEGQVKAVLFDLGGTLVEIDNSEIPHAMKRALEDCGINRSLEDVSQSWVKSWEGLNFRDLANLLDKFYVRWNVQILCNLRIDPNAGKLTRFIATHWWDYSKVTLYLDAKNLLPQLKRKGLKIGLITSGLRKDINKMLSKVGLQNFFDIVVTTDTLRKMKPETEVFHHALEKLKIAPSEAIFIGDEIETDYKGAQKSGLIVFLIDRRDKFQDKSLNRISNLEDLLHLISA